MLNYIRKLYESLNLFMVSNKAGQGRLQVAKIISRAGCEKNHRAGQGQVAKFQQGRLQVIKMSCPAGL